MSVFKKKMNVSDFQNKTNEKSHASIIEIECDKITCLQQVRSGDNEGFSDASIEELAQSIKTLGQLSPALVKKDSTKPGYYIMIAGERRLRAVKSLGFKLKALVQDLGDIEARKIQIAENIQRENLNQMEIASAVYDDYKRLKSLDLTAGLYHKSINWVSQMIQFYETVSNETCVASKLVKENLTSDITAITTLGKLEKIDVQAAQNALDALKDEEDVNVRGSLQTALKSAKKQKKDDGQKKPRAIEKAKKQEPSKKEESKITCKTFSDLLKMTVSAQLIDAVFISVNNIPKSYTPSVIELDIIISNNEKSKNSQTLNFIPSNKMELTTVLTSFMKTLPKDKFSNEFEIIIHFAD